MTRGVLIRFHDQDYLESFLDGKILFRSLRQFAKEFESDEERGDAFEGTDLLLHEWSGGLLQIEVDGRFEPVGQIREAPKQYQTGSLNFNIFCLYAAEGVVGPLAVDARNLRLGDAVLVVKEPAIFIQRVRDAAVRDHGFDLTSGPVKYVDTEVYRERMGPFVKSNKFAHQCEYRLVLSPGTSNNLILEVGDLRDLISVFRASDLARMRFE